MGKSMEELMFGAENQALVHEAVRRAVARADAAGLPRAYKMLPELAPSQQDAPAEEAPTGQASDQ